MAYLRRLELRFKAGGLKMTADRVIEEVRHLHSVLMLPAGARKPRRRLERPTETQREVPRALGWPINASGVLPELGR